MVLLAFSGEPSQLWAMLVNNDWPGAIVVVFDPTADAIKNNAIAISLRLKPMPKWCAGRASHGAGTIFTIGEIAARGICITFTGYLEAKISTAKTMTSGRTRSR